MKSIIEGILAQKVQNLRQLRVIPHKVKVEIRVERTKDRNHGDYTTNLALILAKPCGQTPGKMAELLLQASETPAVIERIEIVGSGLINFFISPIHKAQVISKILREGEKFGCSDVDAHQLKLVLANLISEATLGNLLLRKQKSPLYFEQELAKSTDNESRFYSIQYAYARTSGVLRQLEEWQLAWNEQTGLCYTDLLIKPQEILLISLMFHYPEVIESVAKAGKPLQIVNYLHALANGLHSYYNAIQLLCEQEELRCARLCLLKAVRQVLCNGIQLLGVSAHESM